jgi:hypothetical protein
VTYEPTELGSILDGTATPVDVPDDVEPTGETPEVETTPEAAPPAAEKPPEAKPEDKPPPGHVPFQALHDERRKRQELESRLAALEAEKAPEAKPNLFEDPDNWEKALDERVERKLNAVRQESEHKFLVLVEQAAKARHADFEDVAKVFAETARTTPGLIEEARNAPDPAEFIYQAGKNLKRYQEAGSIDELIRQAESRGEERARQSLQAKPAPVIPESLTEIAGGKGESSPQWAGPTPLAKIIPSY